MSEQRYYALRNKVTGELLPRTDYGDSNHVRKWKDPKPPALFYHPSHAYISRGARYKQVADPNDWEAVQVIVQIVEPIPPFIPVKED